jgi:predicted ribosome quality control (RQC) complex YloA/Tae2 family protein
MDELTLKFLAAELNGWMPGMRVAGAWRGPGPAWLWVLETPGGRRRGLTVAVGEGGAFFPSPVAPPENFRPLRSRLEGAVVTAVVTHGDDRIVVVTLATDDGPCDFTAELYGRAGAALVCAEGRIVEVWAGRSREAGEPYAFPAACSRIAVGDLDQAVVAEMLAAGDAAALVNRVRYMSPPAARAITAPADMAERGRRFGVFAALAAADDRPRRCLAAHVGGKWVAFAADIFGASETREFGSFGDAAKFVWEGNRDAAAAAAARAALERRARADLARLERQRAAVAADLARYEDAERYRRMGDALKYNLAAVPRGASVVTLADPYGAGDLTVELDAALTPAANVERLFRLYRKAKRGVTAAAARLATLDAALDAARARLAAAAAGEGAGDGAAGETPRAKRRSAAAVAVPGRRYVSSDGFAVLVGRSKAENDELTFGYARPDDLWLHAQQAHGSHVVIRRTTRGKEVPRRTVEEAAALAALYSGARHARCVPVVAVERRYVRRVRGAPGRVTFSREEVLFVEPAELIKPAPKAGS